MSRNVQLNKGYKGQGFFTYTLLQAFKKADTFFGNKDRQTSIFEIAQYIDNVCTGNYVHPIRLQTDTEG